MDGLRLSVLLVSVALGACVPGTSEVSDLPAPRAIAAQRLAVVELTAQLPHDEHEQRVEIDVAAHFVESRDLDRSAVMSLLGIWLPTTASNGCVVRRDDAGGPAHASVRLLDAGNFGIVGNGGSAVIAPRSIAPWSPQVSGWLYRSSGNLGLSYAWAEPYSVWFDGSPDVGAFVTELAAPAPLAIVAINGSMSETGQIRVPGEAPLLEIELDAGDETVPAWLTIEGFGDAAAIECRVTGESRVRFERTDIDALFGERAPLSLSLRRVERRPLPPAAGIGGEFVFAFVDRVEVVR